MTQNNLQFAFMEREGDHSDLQVEFTEEYADELVEKYGWLEFTRRLKDNRVQHFLMPPTQSSIRCIKWEE